MRLRILLNRSDATATTDPLDNLTVSFNTNMLEQHRHTDR